MKRSLVFLWWSSAGLLVGYAILNEIRVLPERPLHVFALMLLSLFLTAGALMEHEEQGFRRKMDESATGFRFSLLQLLVLTLGVGLELGVVVDLLKAPHPFVFSWVALLVVPPLTLMAFTLTKGAGSSRL